MSDNKIKRKKVLSVVGKRLPNVDAADKVTGKAIYTSDMKLPKMIYGKILKSPLPHAKILKIDTSKAKELPGVHAVITAVDTPNVLFGVAPPPIADKLIFAKDKVRCIGDEVAAVAAETEDIAEQALELIEVTYEELSPVFFPEDSMKEDAPLIHDDKQGNLACIVPMNCGDVDKGFEEADVIIEQTYDTQSQAHCCMETQCAIAEFDSNDRVTLWSTTQAPHDLRERLAPVCNIAMHNIRVVKLHVGGGFGRSSRIESYEAASVLLARKTGRPVKIQFTREEEFEASRNRHPISMTVKLGAKKDGTLTAKQILVIADNGAYNSWGPIVLSYSCCWFSALYRTPNIRFEGRLFYTNKNGGGSFRGFGDIQMTFAQESAMDELAEKLGMDIKDLKLKNANQPNELTGNKIQVNSCGLSECIQASADGLNWDKKKITPGSFTGVGMASMVYTAGASKAFGKNFSTAFIKFEPDGSFTLFMGASDIGQGSNTVLAQIAAEELGVGLDRIRRLETDTAITPPCQGTYGSRVTMTGGNAVYRAARKVRRKILEVASEKLEARIDDLELENGKVFVKDNADKFINLAEIANITFFDKEEPINCTGYYNGPFNPGKDFDPVSWKGLPAPGLAFANQAAEVKVDPDTGEVDVLKIVAAHDVGKSINPMSCEGQVEGGVAQGIGYALSEEIKVENGKVMNPNFTDYKYMTSMDIPDIETILVETDELHGPYGAKGIGEAVSIPTAPALANAIYNATGHRFRELPITPEKILIALKDSKEGKAK